VLFNIVSNLTNGVGLQRDYELLRRELEIRGHIVRGVQFNARPFLVHGADVNIFLEVVNPAAFGAATKQWAIPNPEWWFSGWDSYPWDVILAKTRDCERIFKAKVGDKCRYLGWIARDLYDSTIPKERKFLHVSGKSRFKNTAAVVLGCHRAGVRLTLIGEPHPAMRQRVNEPELKRLMNSHFCHIMPSAYEGYGHVLHEAMACGQVIITTNAPPMNEIIPSVLVPSIGTATHHAGLLHRVSPLDLARAITTVLNFPPEQIEAFQQEGRAQYEQERGEFLQALDALVGKPQ